MGEGFQWEFNTVEIHVKAWCMPGGKVYFYTGLIDLADNESWRGYGTVSPL